MTGSMRLIRSSHVNGHENATAKHHRYRERKRVKADTMKVLGANQLASLSVEVPVIVAAQDSAQPVNAAPLDSSASCVQNAHAVRQNEACTNGTVLPELASTGGSISLSRVEQSDVALGDVLASPMTASENKGTPKSIPSRRNWKTKTEARNKI
ncbi:hypothetical protein FXO38_12282 [Capsicum annuum]|nr:hypothetical protein FXO38_12282 [Capsicum annuum]